MWFVAVAGGIALGVLSFGSMPRDDLVSIGIFAVVMSLLVPLFCKRNPWFTVWCSWGKVVMYGACFGRMVASMLTKPSLLFPQELVIAVCTLISYLFIPFPRRSCGTDSAGL